MQCMKSRQGESRTWVMLLEKNILGRNSDEMLIGTLDIVKLRHPRTGAAAMFLFSSDNSVVHEIFTLSEEKSSWFIDDMVKKDGKLYLSTPFDPLFLILPYLKRAKEDRRVIPLDDLLVDESFLETHRLLKCLGLKNINLIADMKGDPDLNAWSYNEEKVLKWLSRKIEKVVEVLKKKNIVVGDAVSDSFENSTKDASLDQEKELYLAYACGLASEYLTSDLSEKLHSYLNLTRQITNNKLLSKRKSVDDIESVKLKKIKTDSQANNLSKCEKRNRNVSVKEKSKLLNCGSKQITSFFKIK